MSHPVPRPATRRHFLHFQSPPLPSTPPSSNALHHPGPWTSRKVKGDDTCPRWLDLTLPIPRSPSALTFPSGFGHIRRDQVTQSSHPPPTLSGAGSLSPTASLSHSSPSPQALSRPPPGYRYCDLAHSLLPNALASSATTSYRSLPIAISVDACDPASMHQHCTFPSLDRRTVELPTARAAAEIYWRDAKH
ncbi:hypothetical protein FA15DRAFT_224679 [Coprinopsis marcescibilis]|uniref:Uncharacterized protein n=1 Tax=Coprinopsis marcescibilis TaxID=230819 RepID=A0A5C3KFX9_COPMA|nr:hypothetical protein FA15DRAFT_224679 [Coprinopsis marcescibilis]